MLCPILFQLLELYLMGHTHFPCTLSAHLYSLCLLDCLSICQPKIPSIFCGIHSISSCPVFSKAKALFHKILSLTPLYCSNSILPLCFCPHLSMLLPYLLLLASVNLSTRWHWFSFSTDQLILSDWTAMLSSLYAEANFPLLGYCLIHSISQLVFRFGNFVLSRKILKSPFIRI